MIQWLLAAAAAAIAGCQEPPGQPPPSATTAAGVQPASDAGSARPYERGRGIYNFRCYYCHGYSGDARTLAATFLDPRPRDFTALAPSGISREQMLKAVSDGIPGTAMKGFSAMLSKEEMEAVVDFVRHEFIEHRRVNTRYHTAANGWPDHDRYAGAFPFATGELPLDTPWEALTIEQRQGKRLYLASCISCHDRSKVADEGVPWDLRPLSYPRNQFVPGASVDATAGASPYAIHDRPPQIAGMTTAEKRGEKIYQDNCAFCHAADGTGRNWIGRFLEPHPRDLTAPEFMAPMTRERLAGVIREGLPGTSMPAWKHVLSDDQIEALIDYVSRAFHPVGASGKNRSSAR